MSAQELIAGWEGTASLGYGFVSPVAVEQLGGGHALVARSVLSYLYYDTAERSGRQQVRSPGLAAALGYRLATSRVTLTLGAGYEIRSSRRRTAADTVFVDLEAGAALQGDMFLQANLLTSLFALAAYGDANDYLWSRVGFRRQVTNTDFRLPVSLGVAVELTLQGNRDIRTYQLGPALTIDLPRAATSFQVRGGYAASRFGGGAEDRRVYFGGGLYRAF